MKRKTAKKLKKRIKKMENRIHKIENPGHEVRVIGFQQLCNMQDDNEYDWEEDE